MFIINHLVQCVEACTELLREELQLSQQIYTYYINHPLEKNQAIWSKSFHVNIYHG